MKLLLTGGSGDLGTVLSSLLIQRADRVLDLDLRPPSDTAVQFIQGSILDRDLLKSTLPGIDCLVHIAGWHGIHEFRKEKDAFDFFDLNVTGTFNLLESCVRTGVNRFVFISSTSVDDWPGIYAHSKLLCEDLMRTYVARHGMRIITLRPRAFIPHSNRQAYPSINEWAKWYWKGAIHIDDVAQATLKAIAALQTAPREHAVLTLDGACEFSAEELAHWDSNGPGSTFRQRFGDGKHKLAVQCGLDPALKPKILGSSDAERIIGYKANYGFADMLNDLSKQAQVAPLP